MNELDNMPIKKIKFPCTHKGASKLTGEKLSKELSNIGLDCKQASPEKCEIYIKEVSDKLYKGKYQSFHYYFEKNTTNENIDPEWEPSDSPFDYQSSLSFVISEENFKILYKDFCDFPGREFSETTREKETNTVESIKDFFTTTLISASSFMVEGIEKESLKAMCINILGESEDPENYIVNNHIIIYLLKNYNEKEKTVDAVGVVYLKYDLNIEDYNDKKSGLKHKSILKYSGRSVTYSDGDLLKNHAAYCNHISNMLKINNNSAKNMPIYENKAKIFEKLPPPNWETYQQGSNIGNQGEVLILYSPNLEEIAIVDNEDSDTDISYSISISTGISNSQEIGFSNETYIEVGCDIAKAGVKMSFSSTITKDTTTTHEKTITYNVPSGKKAYLYQGYILYGVLAINLESGAFYYARYGVYSTDFIKTSRKALIN